MRADPWLRRLRQVAAVPSWALLVLASACGQGRGVHQQPPAFRETIATVSVAHGQSSKTRSVPSVSPSPSPPPSGTVINGTDTLQISAPTPAADGSLVVTYVQWAAAFVERIPAPACANNVVAVVAWAEQESTVAGWNPLATTLSLPGATLFNSAGVKNYQTLEQGLDASLMTLQKGLTEHGYGAIVEALQRCADPVETAVAINASDWCGGCAGGLYVTGVVPGIIRAYNRAQENVQ
jgi:hypothetical protein